MAKQLASTLAVDSQTRKCFELSPTFLLSRLFSLRQRTVSRSRSSQNNFRFCVDPDPDLHKNLYVFLLPRNRNPSLGHQNPETERETHLVDIPTCISHFSPNITPKPRFLFQTTLAIPLYLPLYQPWTKSSVLYQARSGSGSGSGSQNPKAKTSLLWFLSRNI
jgi:hypothetical protein